ncbi:membrane-associated phosphatidylinositol transfer protein 1 isoform X2 [Elgaria multicarinata webbii]
MLRAHRQAWCWQDEWIDLTMDDIRRLEEETARMLAQKMATCMEPEIGPAVPSPERPTELGACEKQDRDDTLRAPDSSPDDPFAKQWSTSSRSSYSSQHAVAVSPHSLSEWRMQNIARDSENSSEEEFFDAHEDFSDSDDVFAKEITKWNSNDFLDTLERPSEPDDVLVDTAGAAKPDSDEVTAPGPPEAGSEDLSRTCRIHALFLILHSGNILDQGVGEPGSKQADVHTLTATLDSVTRLHFPEALGHIALRLVPCPPICAAAYALVSKLSPYSHDGDSLSSSQDHIPLAALPLLATSSGSYQNAVATVISRTNQAYANFIHSPDGTGFCGQVLLIGDCVGGILAFDALCQSRVGGSGSRGSSRRGSMNTELLSPETSVSRDPLLERAEAFGGMGRASPEPGALPPPQRRNDNVVVQEGDSLQQQQQFLSSLQASMPASEAEGDPRRSSNSSSSMVETFEGPSTVGKLEFKVSGFFLFGSPLGLVLALRKTVMPAMDVAQMRPSCEQIYNLFHAADPCASRLEPLLAQQFHAMPPFAVPRYQKYPLGDGSSTSLAEALQTHSALFMNELDLVTPPTPTGVFGGFWKGNEATTSENTVTSTSEVVKILDRWWGAKRIDYSLYCPEALTAFPTITLPHLFHASYWESADVAAFILRQVIETEQHQVTENEESSIYSPAFPREKWQRKRTQVKIRNVTANHRAGDVIVCEGQPQALNGRFMYGPLDVVTLTGEKVDIYIMAQPLSGKWVHYGTEVTSGSGRLSYTLAEEKMLGIGMYPVRMVVRGDHTYAECFLTVVAKSTPCVVFSIDGSFTASVSIMGSDPKVRAGAVDVVRHWQDSGFMIIYVTGRPDMQKHRVVAWLTQHNFPHGIVSFCDGLTHDPLRQKAAFLQGLQQEAEVTIVAGYGSTKDISVYSSLGLPPAQIYIVGRAVKKLQNQCQFLSDGYVAHLAQLEAASLAHSPKGTTRPTLAKGSYGCPAPVDFLRKQSQLLRSRGQSQAEREGSGSAQPRAKARSVSLKLESEE